MLTIDGVLLSFALGIDAAIVAFAIGLSHPDKSHKQGLILGAWFGFFQWAMALIGWSLVHSIQVLRPWAEKGSAVVFILLGCKLIYDAFVENQYADTKIPSKHHEYFLLAIATSLDSLAAGVGLVTFDHPMIVMLLIGLVAFGMSWVGFLLSHHFRKLPESLAEVAGAIILIFLGAKTLLW